MDTAVDTLLNEAGHLWWQLLPVSVRKHVTPAKLKLLLTLAGRYLADGSPQSLADVGSTSFRLARELEQGLSREEVLETLRGGLVRTLLERDPASTFDEARLARLVGRVSDSAWHAYAERLESTIQHEQHERIRQELRLAKRIQERLLPRDVPSIPGYDIAGKVLPAEAVGGDYWSSRHYPEDGIVTFKLADITGHGIAAAMLVAAVKFISGGYYRGAKTPGLVMERTNNVLVRETPNEILVTMVYGWLYPSSHEISLVNAGHAPVLHWHEGGVSSIPPTGVALGMIETRYREVRLDMAPGDVFLTCSDGITEPSAVRALGDQWVSDRLVALHERSAAEIVSEIISAALAEYGTPQDDMSVLVVKRAG